MHATSVPATTITTGVLELFVALELSSKTWVVAAHIQSSEKISQYRVNAGDTASLLALIERLRPARSWAKRDYGESHLLLRSRP